MAERVILHASCVALDGCGALILGPSGSGKSALALALIGLGASLVADDRTELRAGASGLVAAAPAAIRGRIEARGFGLLTAPAVEAERIVLAVDLGRQEGARLPDDHMFPLLGQHIPLRYAIPGPHLAPAILLWLRAARDGG